MLFKTSDKVKEYAQITGDINSASYRVTMEAVEKRYLKPVLGKELFESLTNTFADGASDEPFDVEIEAALLDLCRRVTGPFFCYHYAPKTDVQVSDAGVQRTETSTNKTAYQYQSTKYREENYNEGQDAIENLLAFLEEKIDDFPLWSDSDEFKQYRSLFIKTASEFNSIYPSPAPQRNYWALRPKMADVEEISIKNFLGSTLYNALKEKAKEPTPGFTEKETALIRLLSKAIAYFTVAAATPFLAVKMTPAGITIPAAASFSSNDNENTRAGADPKMLASLIESCNHSGSMWLEQAALYMKENKDDFTDWPGNTTTTTTECNKDFESVFGLT
jgi:hypothetical protein